MSTQPDSARRKRLTKAAVACGMTLAWAAATVQPALARTDCAYAPGPVYAELGPGAGTSGQAALAAGACVDIPGGIGGFHGGLVEAGVGPGAVPGTVPAVYAVADVDDDHTLGSTALGGYVGLSNFETGAKSSCGGASTGNGTNSGGCLTIRNVASIPVPLIACGNTNGKSWENTVADGCTLP